MPQTRKTRAPIYVSLSEARIQQIEALVNSWSSETRRFVLRRLHQYTPTRSLTKRIFLLIQGLFKEEERKFDLLQDPGKLNDWHNRFEAAGSQNATAAWNRILSRELDQHDHQYLTSLLEKETIDTFVPKSLSKTFDKLYHAFILKEYSDDPEIPRAPLILVIGNSGSGKSATIKQAIEETFFSSEVTPVVDLKAKRDEVMANQPFWRSLAEVDPELAIRIERRRKRAKLRIFSRLPIVRYLFRNRISQALSSLDEEGVRIDYAMITPNDYQTALAGEPGNYLRKAMGNPARLCLRHMEEAHSAFGVPDERSSIKSQQSTLVDTSNIILDEIAHGRRDCILIATTDQPEQLDPAIYRRFVERGLIIDVNDIWENPANLREVVCLELRRKNHPKDPRTPHSPHLSEEELDQAVEKLYPIFHQRSLRITPAYVRRLISSLITIKGSFRPNHLDDQLLVRDALKTVARNVHGSIYSKVVAQMDRSIAWKEYIGGIKNEFSEMANNSLFYNINDEKGVVLTGPPGSGKTFMVRAWLGDNHDVQDICANLTDLTDVNNPLEGMVANLERIYDIAKMISPAMVFFDEGDAVAPRRQKGGSPYDKITNKFLSIIDGETPLHRVFTVLTTNRLDIIDPALIRSKRLKVLNVTGHLREEDCTSIIAQEMAGIPLADGLTIGEISRQANALCETPADYTAYAEKVRSLRTTELEVIRKAQQISSGTSEEKSRFVRFNYKILLGLLEGMMPDSTLTQTARQSEDGMLSRLDEIISRLAKIEDDKDFPITAWHMQTARQQLASSPLRKSKQQLDEFLETELSEEPQVGFVVGVGANDVSGILLPIASALVYRMFPEKIVVTGAVSTSAAAGAELDLAVQMTHQSSREALTLVETYLQSLVPKINLSRLLGEYLDGYSLHHQLLSTSYNVGGPSAGFALAINTLSVLVHLPVLNDFGITGAPWIKGARKGEIGASVIIGGHHKKTEKVLQYLQRMYMPVQNYLDMEPEVLDAYRTIGKDVVAVSSFSSLVPEVFYIDNDYQQQLQMFFQNRLEIAMAPASLEGLAGIKQENLARGKKLRLIVEEHIRQRLLAIEKHMQDKTGGFKSLEAIFSLEGDEV
ncbi:AAA family ATPase [Malonomonas rubra]|uniref:AAA family ATPase n=1 Tax=Malonomonas rubra TaxID=57040 RepID=UPI0026F34C33|nr:AAA family ATPase [Malonomonas rubra]